MTKTVVALFDQLQQAEKAVKDLEENGISSNHISLVANDRTGQYQAYLNGPETPGQNVMGAGMGEMNQVAQSLGNIGNELNGLGALVIPGIGRAIAAGPMTGDLNSSAPMGTIRSETSNILRALENMGLNKDQAGMFAEGVLRGGAMITVQINDEMAGKTKGILDAFDPIDMKSRVSEWEKNGWSGFDPNYLPPDEDLVHHYPSMQNLSEENRAATNPEPSRPTPDIEPSSETGTRPSTAEYTEQFNNEIGTGIRPFDFYALEFQDHFNGHFLGHGTYKEFEPAYFFGYTLAIKNRFNRKTWNELAPLVKEDWERQYPGTWDRFELAIQDAFQTVKESY